MTKPIRIVVADDHPIIRDGLMSIFSSQPEFEVVGQAGTGLEALKQVSALKPDVLLLDLAMPELDGLEVLEQLAEAKIKVRVIVFTAFDTDERILGAIRAGAQGYLLKGAPREELFKAIRIVHAGGSLLQPVVASKLMRQVSHQSQPEAEVESLTTRELEVLRLIARGLRNKEIATRLTISQRTVKFHNSSIMSKLGASNRTEAVRMAVQQGLVKF